MAGVAGSHAVAQVFFPTRKRTVKYVTLLRMLRCICVPRQELF